MWSFSSASANQLKDLAAPLQADKFACPLRCGLCGFRRRTHSLLTESLILDPNHNDLLVSKKISRVIPIAGRASSGERGRGCVQTGCWFEKQPLTKRTQSGTDWHAQHVKAGCAPTNGPDRRQVATALRVTSRLRGLKKIHPKRQQVSLDKWRSE